MATASERQGRRQAGETIEPLELTALSGEAIRIPDPGEEYVHLQLRRFAGCPICNLHLRSVVTRHQEIRAQGIREVVVFHSTTDELSRYEADLPFALIADPDRELYRRFGVESGIGSLLSTTAARAAVAGAGAVLRRQSAVRGVKGPVMPNGGRLGLPADLLIGADGRLVAVKYGEHAYDQWSVDALLEQVRADRSGAAGPAGGSAAGR